MGALSRQDPRAWNAAKSRDQSEDPERHGTHPEEVAVHVFRQARDELDDEAEDGALGFDNEAHLLTGVRTHQLLHVAGAQPPPDAKGGHRPQREADRGVEEPDPLAEEIAAEDARHLTRDRRNNDLERLKGDEDDG